MIPRGALFDTHAHLDEFQPERLLEEVVHRAREAGIGGILAIGTTAETSQRCVEIAQSFPDVWAAVGLQPNYCAQASERDWDVIEQLARSPRVVALGETGLDRYWDHTPWDIQTDFFHRHLRLSGQMKLPLVIHMRDCEGEMLALMEQNAAAGEYRGIMHSFTGTSAGVSGFLKLGLHISFAGMVTYPKSDALRETAGRVPAERLLVETDSPYLPPHPHRNRRPNEPAMVVHTARCLAETRGVDLETLTRQTTENACRLFGLPLTD